LNSEKVEYLLVGGYAVGCYGYSRATGDMDVWVAVSPANAAALVRALRQFGFGAGSLSAEMFLAGNRVLRIGVAPLRIDLITSVEGLDFNRCFANRVVETLGGVEVNLICLDDLKTNKRALGRPKDQDDLEHLP
jgi:hypothetical protein